MEFQSSILKIHRDTLIFLMKVELNMVRNHLKKSTNSFSTLIVQKEFQILTLFIGGLEQLALNSGS